MNRKLIAPAAAAMLVALAAPAVMAAEAPPPFWIAVSVGGAELDAGPDARPPAQTNQPLATLAPGQTVNLRAKLVGGRRAYMMWPNTYANIGPNTTVQTHGFDQMIYTVQTEAFFGRGEWTVTDESYAWNTGGQGALSPLDATQERVAWTAPPQAGTFTITVTGRADFHFVRQAPGGQSEQDESSGDVSRTFTIAVMGPAEPQTVTAAEALQHILARFRNLGSGPVEGSAPTYVGSAGFWNNMYSVFTDTHDEYVCGGWQGKVLEMLDAMRNGTDTEKAVFDHYDYGPIQAYYGGHQAVVIYPKGSDWRKTGTVLDPWPNQRPETFTMAQWGDRFWFGVGPSSVYEGQYPLTGGTDYPKPRLKIPPGHMALLRRVPKAQREQYLALTSQPARDQFIQSLPPSVTESTAVAVHSPVKMLITDAVGRRVGWQDRQTFVYEIPGADVDLFPEEGTDHGMVALLPLAEYRVQITGEAPGTFGFMRAMPATVTSAPLTEQREIPIDAGQAFTCRLSPTMPDAPLMGGDGTMMALVPMPVDAVAGAATGTATTTGGQPAGPVGGTTQPRPVTGGAAQGVTITTPRPGDHVAGRVTVAGTGKPGALIVVSTEVRAQDDDELLRDVPGSRHKINDDGTWQVWVAAPELPKNIMEPLYYIIKAHWVTPAERSEPAQVKVFRAEEP